MKTIHRNVKTNKSKINQTLNQLVISDPLYEKDVKCRYENNNIQMNNVDIFIQNETILHHEGDEPFNYGELIIHLSNVHKNGDCTEKKNYEIGVDTARYIFETEQGSVEIVTGADGDWGEVCEEYYEGKLGALYIYLTIPEEYIMPEDEFISDVLSAMNIKEPEMVVMIDENMDIEMESEVQDKEMKMTT